jgi:NCAIR mutase (PurE)-related protein
MDNKQLKDLIDGIRSGKVSTEAALQCLKKLPFEDLGYAKVDHHRCLRNGVPEVIYCAGKTVEQVKGIVERMLPHHSNILATRAESRHYEAI